MQSIIFDDDVHRRARTLLAREAHTQLAVGNGHPVHAQSVHPERFNNVAEILETQCGVLLGCTSDTMNVHVDTLWNARIVKANIIETARFSLWFVASHLALRCMLSVSSGIRDETKFHLEFCCHPGNFLLT